MIEAIFLGETCFTTAVNLVSFVFIEVFMHFVFRCGRRKRKCKSSRFSHLFFYFQKVINELHFVFESKKVINELHFVFESKNLRNFIKLMVRSNCTKFEPEFHNL